MGSNVLLSDAKVIVERFVEAAALAGATLTKDDVEVEVLPAPHRPTGLGVGKMGVYVFIFRGTTLKVGKAGPNSDARFRSQHYLPGSSASNLAASILKDGQPVGNPAVDASTVGSWIKENTDRINFRLRAREGIPALNLLEAFVQLALDPVYEGFATQKV